MMAMPVGSSISQEKTLNQCVMIWLNCVACTFWCADAFVQRPGLYFLSSSLILKFFLAFDKLFCEEDSLDTESSNRSQSYRGNYQIFPEFF